MYDKDFAELVKIAAEKLKEDTVYQMIRRSEGYQEESNARGIAEQHYIDLDLTKAQRKVCDALFDYRDRENRNTPIILIWQDCSMRSVSWRSSSPTDGIWNRCRKPCTRMKTEYRNDT